MAQSGDDCYFFYFQTCVKGAACPFRHVEEAKRNEVTCDDWRLGRCRALLCPMRHMELQKNTPCYFENQPGGCTKPNCPFLHKLPPKPSVLASTAPATQPVIPTIAGIPPVTSHPPGPWTSASAPGPFPPGVAVWPQPHIPPPHMFPRVPLAGPPRMSLPGFPPYGPPPVHGNMIRPGHIVQIEPVIINPNEESDQDSIKGSPMKPATVKVQPPSKIDNPLDYFLNAKPWVDPSPRPVSRSPSPRRLSPYRRQDSSSPRRSESPEGIGRRRSVSVDRFERRRSVSPEWRDRRRFVRRSSRSPPRKRSRSPGRGRTGGLLNRFRTDTKGPRLEEVRVTGPKVISIRKTKTDSEDAENVEKDNEKKEDIQPPQKDDTKLMNSKSAPVIEDEVKSLEDIYRERALLSLMEAKRKKILENKRKKWEKLDASKKSESEKSDKSEDVPVVDEKGDKPEEKEEADSSDSADGEDNKSDNDLPDDIDIELGEGELESDHENEDKEEGDHQDVHTSEEELPENSEREKPRSSINVPGKPSIKSRLGLKTVEQISRQAVKDRLGNTPPRRSVKERLGLKPDLEKPVRSGVIKLNRESRADDIMSRIRINRDLREKETKNILMVPQITIKNQPDIEERKAGLKQRLGGLLNDDDENSNDSRRGRRKKKSIDEELMKLLREEEADIDEEDLELLSKKEKKKLLKRLLVQQGREDEYEEIARRRKKKGFRKKKDTVDEEGDRESRRKINIRGRNERKKEDREEEEEYVEDEGDLMSEEEEIVLGEATLPGQEKSAEKLEKMEGDMVTDRQSEDKEPKKSESEIQKDRDEKEARLKEALEPKSLDDIRKERALKRAAGDGSMRISTGQNKRRIVMEEPEVEKPVEPAVRITFEGLGSSPPKRKLIQLGKSREQNENDQPTESRVARAKRERQIYVPPKLKRIEAPETKAPDVSSRLGGPPRGREIVDYGDMFLKSASSSEKRTTVRLTVSASESDLTARLPLRLQRGPPKVEVKDATVKTFAEIMAEKKRKRMLAQQGKSFTPVAEEYESSSQSSLPEDRLSPSLSESQPNITPSSATSVPSQSITLRKSVSATNLQQTEKPTRWKKQKLNNTDTSSGNFTSQEISLDLSEDSNSQPTNESGQTVSELKDISQAGQSAKFEAQGDVHSVTSSSSPVEIPPISVEATTSKPGLEKKGVSENFLDFDDDLLDMEEDLELGETHQDADELMREIDELLS